MDKLLIVLAALGVILWAIAKVVKKDESEPAEKMTEKPELVYVVGDGTKYHTKSCPLIKSQSVTRITPISLPEAVSRGLSECKRCSNGS